MRPSDKATWLAAVLFPLVLLLLFANALIFDPQTYNALLSPESVPVTLQLIEHYRGAAPMPDVFNELEKSHLNDVRLVVRALGWLALVLFVVFLAALPFADPARVFVRGFLLLLGVVLILTVIPFDWVFDRFHLVVFPQGNWMFPLDSMLIRLYPFSFFQAFFSRILELTLVFSAVFALLGCEQKSLLQHNKA